MTPLDKKIERAIKIIRMASSQANEIEICYSGGKDSDVILKLAQMAGVNHRAIYKNTTIDPPYTIQHCREKGAEIIRPKQTFFQLVERCGFPSRFNRFCCSKLKEYKVLDVNVQGIRRSESPKRAERYSPDDPIICRTYGSKKNHANVALPILEWTDDDVAEFVNAYDVKCHPLYYDEDGRFNAKRRLGCMGCPLKSRQGIDDFVKRPNLVKAWCRAGQTYMDTHPNAKANKLFEDVYDKFMYHLFYHSMIDYREYKYNLFGKADSKKILEDYFGIKF